MLGDLQRRRLNAPVQRIVLAATMTGKLGIRQPMLADLQEDTEATSIDLARLVDALSGRLGRQRVLGAELAHNPLPEQAVRLRPLAGQPMGTMVPGRPVKQNSKHNSKRHNGRRQTRATGRHNGRSTHQPISDSSQNQNPAAQSQLQSQSVQQPPLPSNPLRRPLFLHPKPPVLTPLPSQPTTATTSTPLQPPMAFRRGGGKIERVVRFWGPERLETGWWNGPMQRRDYFRIETQQGQWLWIYHDLRANTWHLHGHFA